MSVTMVRQKVKDGSVHEAEAAVRDFFATLDRVRPEGVRYASTRVVDSSTFVILYRGRARGARADRGPHPTRRSARPRPRRHLG